MSKSIKLSQSTVVDLLLRLGLLVLLLLLTTAPTLLFSLISTRLLTGSTLIGTPSIILFTLIALAFCLSVKALLFRSIWSRKGFIRNTCKYFIMLILREPSWVYDLRLYLLPELRICLRRLPSPVLGKIEPSTPRDLNILGSVSIVPKFKLELRPLVGSISLILLS